MSVIPYGRHFITDDDINAVIKVLKSDFLTQGPAVKEFEDKFAKYVGAKYAVALTNGTAALHLGAIALGVKSGQKVLVTSLSFAASANCVRYCGADVEFVDIDPVTYNIDLKLLEQKLKDSPKGAYAGVIPVDFAGLPVDLEKVRSLANQYGLWIMEDACHAPGAEFQTSTGQWHKSGDGTFADLTVFSFHPVKHIALGEGGLITTNNEKLYKHLMTLRTHGITRDPAELIHNDGGWYYEMQELGFNYRISDILCGLGTSQLSRADQMLKRRQEIAAFYDKELKSLPLTLPKVNEKQRHAYHLYVIQVDNRKQVYDDLKKEGIYAQVHYLPIHKQPYHQ